MSGAVGSGSLVDVEGSRREVGSSAARSKGGRIASVVVVPNVTAHSATKARSRSEYDSAVIAGWCDSGRVSWRQTSSAECCTCLLRSPGEARSKGCVCIRGPYLTTTRIRTTINQLPYNGNCKTERRSMHCVSGLMVALPLPPPLTQWCPSRLLSSPAAMPPAPLFVHLANISASMFHVCCQSECVRCQTRPISPVCRQLPREIVYRSIPLNSTTRCTILRHNSSTSRCIVIYTERPSGLLQPATQREPAGFVTLRMQ